MGQAPVDIAAHLLDRFAQTTAFRELSASLGAGAGANVWVRGLSGSARALLVASLARRQPGRILLAVAPDAATAEDLKDDLCFLLGSQSASVFPDWGVAPYVYQHPKAPARAARIETLTALARPDWRGGLPACVRLEVVVATATALATPVPTQERLLRAVTRVAIGESIAIEDLAAQLVRAGYSGVAQVAEYGDFSRRGGLLDVFSFGRENPVRIEFDGDEVASIREFDSFSQRSVATLSEVVLLPLWEWLVDREVTDHLLAHPPQGMDEDAVLSFLESIESDGTLEGIEWCLPAMGMARAWLRDYFAPGAEAVLDGPTFIRSKQQSWLDEARAAYQAQASEVGAPAGVMDDEVELWAELDDEDETAEGSPADSGPAERSGPGPRESRSMELPPGAPDLLFNLAEDWRLALPEGALIHLGSGGSEVEEAAPPDAQVRHEFFAQPPVKFERNVEQTRGYLLELLDSLPEIHVLCDSENHRDRLADLMKMESVQFHVGNLAAGFLLPREGLAVLTDHEIFARLRRRAAPRRFSRGLSMKELLALTPGDFVVHVEHGIGLYRGLSRLVMSGQETDCLTLEYAGGDLHYVPVDQLDKVQKYSADDGARPSLSRLGGKQWAQTKARIKKAIKDMADELIKIYAVRKARPGHAFSADSQMLLELEASFPYDETPDQLRAIDEVKRDMETPNPMDRLVCGDVGYGKTEVAIRAAMKAVADGKQVAVLVPTTLLAHQHWKTFSGRLAGFPVRVDFLSRFRTPVDGKRVTAEVKEGKVDILIGTHAILAKAVEFRDLGLVVIDEEQLFGVAAKEKLKKVRDTVDVLTLTATPIPRTMHLAMMGGRDMSTILTPPADRRSIQTEIVEFRDDLITHALMREADRGGQSFFVHNRVESIDQMANYVSRLVPHLRVAVGHGQMRERALEDVMKRFLDGEYDVLVSTMIIESGLDLPNVNTILINRGDMFGLAQLYQLRGRVGRSARKAYAYILVPPHQALTENAQKRLKAMEEFEDLGSGYQLALRDLEIRGAGNLLGAEQHGFIVNVGFELYCQLLDEAVRELRGQAPEERIEPRMVTDLEAYLPEDYVPDAREKMNLYKTLADARSLERVEELAGEISDRFGRHPDPVRNLLGLRRVRLLSAAVRVDKVTISKELVAFEMGRELKKAEVQRLVQALPFPVEFALGARHVIKFRPKSAEPLSGALILLRTLQQS
ncbi:MAG: transcription-repair coupling factor [Candidatus Eisenbacteria bacterium]|nr:transcription-repair coupling factor [Candidatus Eisenbacteria bacterium]